MGPSWTPAMFLTHLPYLIVAVSLIVFVRRTRKSVERMVSELEELDRRKP
jgi:uncharacterized protein YoxC